MLIERVTAVGDSQSGVESRLSSEGGREEEGEGRVAVPKGRHGRGPKHPVEAEAVFGKEKSILKIEMMPVLGSVAVVKPSLRVGPLFSTLKNGVIYILYFF